MAEGNTRSGKAKKTETRIHPDWRPGITASEAQPGLEDDIVGREMDLARRDGVADPKLEGIEQLVEKMKTAPGEAPDVTEAPGLGAVNTSITGPYEDLPPDIRMQAPSDVDVSGLAELFQDLPFPAYKWDVLRRVSPDTYYQVPGPGVRTTSVDLYRILSHLENERFGSEYELLGMVRHALLHELHLSP